MGILRKPKNPLKVAFVRGVLIGTSIAAPLVLMKSRAEVVEVPTIQWQTIEQRVPDFDPRVYDRSDCFPAFLYFDGRNRIYPYHDFYGYDHRWYSLDLPVSPESPKPLSQQLQRQVRPSG